MAKENKPVTVISDVMEFPVDVKQEIKARDNCRNCGQNCNQCSGNCINCNSCQNCNGGNCRR